MGLFDRLFRKDPGAELARAEELLADGRAYDAFHAARRAAELAAAGPEGDGVRLRAREVEGLARETLVATALEEADRAEADEDYDDAAEWVASALERLTADLEGSAEPPPLAKELRTRLRGLRARAREAARQPTLLRRQEEDEEGEPAGPDPLDLETHFGTLVGTLDEEVAERHYLHRPMPFQQAYVDLNEGRLEEALAAFDALAATEPDDPAVRLERGRCRLLSGDPAGAREDFEAAWPALGDRPLDTSGELSVPALWAEAVLAAGEPGTVGDRLAELAGPDGDDPELLALRGRALLEVGEPAALEEVREVLEAGVGRFPARQDLPYLLAGALRRLGRPDRASATLEAAIAPSCATGSCKKPPLHLPSVRALVALYLDPEGDPEEDEEGLARAGELLSLLLQARGGEPSPEEARLVERYRSLAG